MSECGRLQISLSTIGVPAVILYLLSSACQILSISEKQEVGRTTRTAPFAKSHPDPLCLWKPRDCRLADKGLHGSTAIVNSGVMKACRSITHLFVFLLLWITVSIADSSLEWNENKTVIHRVKLCTKGKKTTISLRSSALSPWWVICSLGNKGTNPTGGGRDVGGLWLPLLDPVTFSVPTYLHLFRGTLRNREPWNPWMKDAGQWKSAQQNYSLFNSQKVWGSMKQVALVGRGLLPHHWKCIHRIRKLTQ